MGPDDRLTTELEAAIASPTRANIDRLHRAAEAVEWQMAPLYTVQELCRRGPAEALARVAQDDRWHGMGRHQCLQTLALREAPVLLELVDLTRHEDPFLRSSIARALGFVNNAGQATVLEPLLRDAAQCSTLWAYWRVMDYAAQAIARLQLSSDALERWIAARLAELDGEHHDLGAVSLGIMMHPASIAPLVAMGRAGDEFAFDVLQDYEGAEAARALCQSLEEHPGEAAAHIAYTLGRCGNASCVPHLAALLEGEDPEVRFAAARGLRWLELPEALAVLHRYRDDPDERIVEEVALACSSKPAT